MQEPEAKLVGKRKALVELLSFYDAQNTQQGPDKINVLIGGKSGSGKTTILNTCRQPVLVDSFDPGGTRSIIKNLYHPERNPKGFIHADTRYEDEEASSAKAFRKWEQEFEIRKKNNVFDSVGTYCIDSATTWTEAMMNEILRAQGRPAKRQLSARSAKDQSGLPLIQDYQIQMNCLRDYIKVLTALPCDFILTCHVDLQKDELTGQILGEFMITGKMKHKLPIFFDEVYIMDNQMSSSGITYRLMTRNSGRFEAKSRIGASNFSTYEEPDIMALRKKAGLVN